MKNYKNLLLAALALSALTLTSCLHILEEVTFRNNGSGNYQMTLDMSEVKGMMDMLGSMKGDSTGTDSAGLSLGGADMGNPMGQMGEQLSSVAATLKAVSGLTNVLEINDTANFKFGYSFDFANVESLNKALKLINKEKYDSKVEDAFKWNGKKFERVATADLGQEMKKAMSEGAGEDAEGGADMMKMFLADMSYKQVYHFPERTVKNSSNELSEITDDHTISITLKPFDEEQQKKKLSTATKVKLK